MEKVQNKKVYFSCFELIYNKYFFANFFIKKVITNEARFASYTRESGDSLLDKIMKIIAYVSLQLLE